MPGSGRLHGRGGGFFNELIIKSMSKIRHFTPFLNFSLAVVWLMMVLTPTHTLAADPVTKAVLFYSPSCGHCEYVITEVLPPLLEQYGDQLLILLVDVTQPQGQQLYQNTIQQFQISDDRLGVPTLVCGQTVLVGSVEIPEQFPGIIQSGLSAGGVDWPAIPGLIENLPPEASGTETPPETPTSPPVTEEAIAERPTSTTQNTSIPAQPTEISQATTQPELIFLDETNGVLDRFKQDLFANILAVVVLLGMLVSSGYLAYAFLATNPPSLPKFPNWVIPVVSLLGLGVALYLSYVEVLEADAVCGPVGNCNAVQNSPYAYLFGVIPVGVLGAVGYIAILLGWLLVSRGPISLHKPLNLALWGMAWIGTIFSIYLTFLEPFVIGATCMWCLTSAVLMTILLWATTPAALQALQHHDEDALEPEVVH